MIPLTPLQASPFTAVGDLPLHPLVVHVPVVVLPLTAILLIVAAIAPAVRRRVLGLSVLGAALGLIGVVFALISGDAFAQQVGLPEQHESAAHRLLAASIMMLIASLAWWVSRLAADRSAAAGGARGGGGVPGRGADASSRVREAETADGGSTRAEGRSGSGVLPMILGIVSALAGAAVLIFAVQTGHTGSQAAWSGAVATGDPAGTSSEQDASGAETETASYTMDEVAGHDSPESCWAAIDGGVYDLTDWVGRHPGGEGPIESLCGTDGTEAFTEMHEGNDRVAEQLSEFRLGELAA